MKAQLLFAAEFYFCLHFMQSAVASLLNTDSGFQQDKCSFPRPLGWSQSSAISSGFGWVWLNSAGVVSSWTGKCVLRKSNKVSGSIKCQGADKRWPVCSDSLKSHILMGLKPGCPNFLPKLLLVVKNQAKLPGHLCCLPHCLGLATNFHLYFIPHPAQKGLYTFYLSWNLPLISLLKLMELFSWKSYSMQTCSVTHHRFPCALFEKLFLKKPCK